jgi:predicted Zn-dependent protease
VENEERLGKSVLEQIEADGDVISKGPAVDSLAALGKRLTNTSIYHYQWLILNKKSVNAFALPGGIVVVNAGLINKVQHPDELAAVLAHEIQHVEQRHALQSALSSLGWAAALMVVLGDVNVATAAIAHQLGNLYFSRDKESEADSNGYRLLASKHIKPDGMLTLLQTLKKQPRSDMPEWLSSHPDIDARIAAIQQMIKKEPCPTCQPVELDLAQLRLDIKVPEPD